MLQIEAMAQLGGIVMLDPKDSAAKEQFFFGGIEGCRFRRPVVPGDTLVSTCQAPCASWECAVLNAEVKDTALLLALLQSAAVVGGRS